MECKPQQHVASKMSTKKTFSVLLKFRESKKQINIPDCDVDEAPEDLLDTLEGHLKRIDSNIRLVIDYGAQSSRNASESQRAGTIYILQRFSREWREFVNVIHLVEIGNGDLLKAVPLPRSVSLKDSHEKSMTPDQVSRASCR